MALPASMTPAVSGTDRGDSSRESGYGSGRGEDTTRGTRSGTEGNSDPKRRMGGFRDSDVGMDGVAALATPQAIVDDDNDGDDVVDDDDNTVDIGEMDDDEVLRVLSLLGEEEGAVEGKGGDVEGAKESQLELGRNGDDDKTKEGIQLIDGSSAADDTEDWREEGAGSDMNPAKQLQQRLKKTYSRSRNSRGRSTAIGEDVFEVVESSSRVKDVRKSQLSSPPPTLPSSRSIFSAPLTETASSRNQRSIVPVAGGARTVAEALEALKKPFPLPQRDRDRPRGGVSFSQPVGAVFDTNARLRNMAESPSGTSYSGEEIDRAIR